MLRAFFIQGALKGKLFTKIVHFKGTPRPLKHLGTPRALGHSKDTRALGHSKSSGTQDIWALGHSGTGRALGYSRHFSWQTRNLLIQTLYKFRTLKY